MPDAVLKLKDLENTRSNNIVIRIDVRVK